MSFWQLIDESHAYASQQTNCLAAAKPAPSEQTAQNICRPGATTAALQSRSLGRAERLGVTDEHDGKRTRHKFAQCRWF
jgi:hypothetical protein